jgi:hypothetical protein
LVSEYAPPSVWEDSTQFVRVTGVNPDFVGLPLAGVFVIAYSLADEF